MSDAPLTPIEPLTPIDPEMAASPAELRSPIGVVLLLISLGGIVGALLRYQFGLWWPTADGQIPWTTLIINVTGCGAIGLFMVTLGAVPRPLLRPFLATGILGGYTTFSTYTVDLVHLIRGGHLIESFGYGLGTAAAALAGVVLGMSLGRAIRRHS